MKHFQNNQSYFQDEDEFPIKYSGFEIIEENGLYGLINNDGDVVLPVIYSYISNTISPNKIVKVRDEKGNKKLIEISYNGILVAC